MSLMSLSRGAWEKSGPVGVMGAKAIASAISRPPQAMKGIANETPVSKCCRRFLSISGIEVQCYKRNVVHCSRKPAHRALANVALLCLLPTLVSPRNNSSKLFVAGCGRLANALLLAFPMRIAFLMLNVSRQIWTWNCAKHGSVVCVISPNPEIGEMERLLYSGNLLWQGARGPSADPPL